MAAIFAMSLAAGCTPHKAPLVPLVQGGPLNPALYEQYRLTGEVGAFSARWKRADGEYNFGQLDDVAAQFAESDDVYRRAVTRGAVIGIIANTGAATVGFTLGWNLAANDDTKWSSGTQIAAYGVGAGLILTSLAVAFAWHNPAEDFADVYNASLRRHLGLPDPAQSRAAPTSLWVPRPVGNGFEWRF